MTKRLILTRHTKSSWDDPRMPDHDRPLAPRGQHAAADLGQWLASRGYLPDEVIVSDARRTQETWQGIAPALAQAPAPRASDRLYRAGPDVMLAVLRHASADRVMMIGHNPGLAEFAHRLVARAPIDAGFQSWPTGATLVADFQIGDWAEAGFGAATVVDFVVPREGEG